MYTLRGSDNIEHGPLSARDVREWISRGYAVGSTPARADVETAWRPLAEFVEFQAALAAVALARPQGSAAPVVPSRVVALTALWLGIGGFLFFTAIGAVVLGILAYVLIEKRPRDFAGRTQSMIAVLLGILWLVAVPYAAYYGFLAMQREMWRPRDDCHTRARSLATSLKIASIANNGTYPDAATWCDVIKHEVTSTNHYLCPQDTNHARSGFAYNERLGGAVNPDPQTVAIFESDLGWNASGGASNIIARPRHGNYIMVGYVSGWVRGIRTNEIPFLQWDPHPTNKTTSTGNQPGVPRNVRNYRR
jgi:hypothetical protein